ncbi:sugar ABC transporter substrate-binding protein [Microlunatus elymi]|uniref:Sugar ABC transporter substrate-binding protein n=1 Tax=Microlunatus elymi TaxID=2596828 RepID=A0A516PVR3_9ACTN|nr:sugar ABC transporter substrate-binding protein [Microlunatus elymi]QDP95275.1 sugar ABC transporter substrate-binding protein [Microlunatus elymi]
MKSPSTIKRLLACAAASVLTVTALTSCSGFSGGNGSSDSNDNSSASAKTVSLMTWASPKDRKLYQDSLDKLTEKTGIKVNLVYVGAAAQYYQKINSMVLSNTLPDIFWCSNLNASFQPLAASGKLYDWTPYVNGTASGAKSAELDKSKFGPGYLDLYQVDGKQYGVPNEANTYGVFYNADMFKKAGLSLPTADWTWDDLFKDMKALTKKNGGKVTQYGMQTGWGDLYDPVGASIYSLSNGGNGLASEHLWKGVTKFTDDPQVAAGLKRWNQAIANGSVTGPEFTGQSTWSAFANGKVPMAWGGQWNAVAVFNTKTDMNWGYAPIPRGSSEQFAPVESNAFCSPSKLKNSDATWKVISYMLTDVFNDAYAQDPVAPIAYLPGTTGYFENLKTHGAIGNGIVTTVQQELKNPNKVGTGFLDPWAGKAGNLNTSLWNPMLEGKKPVDPTLKDYVDQVNKLIAAQ